MRRPRFTIAGIMAAVLVVALALGTFRATMEADPGLRLAIAFTLLVAAFPVTAFGIAAFARWAFTPDPGPDDSRRD